MIIVLTGPCGSGKTTVGITLAHHLGCGFIDADDFHSDENRTKMASGIPLTEEDRLPWLRSIHQRLTTATQIILACSALKYTHRQILIHGSERTHDRVLDLFFILLRADEPTLHARITRRNGHFMPASLVQSQVATLEEFQPDERSMEIDGTSSCEDIVQEIIQSITVM